MSILHVCAVRDRQLQAFMRPFTAQSKGQAIRAFRDEVNRKDSEIHAHPEDYELFHCGYFDDQNGTLSSDTAGTGVTSLALATNLLER